MLLYHRAHGGWYACGNGAAHGNPVHPDQDVAESFRQDFQNAVLLAERLGV